MWLTIKNLILRLFGVKPKQTDTDIQRAATDVRSYQDTTKENLTAIFANTLSTLAFCDSAVSINAGKNKPPTMRTQLLDDIMQEQWKNIKQNISIGNGCGMIASLPYSVDNGMGRKIYIDTVTKDRIFVTGVQGNEITAVTVISDFAVIDNKIYTRWTDYSVENSVYIIRQKATHEGNPIVLNSVDDWANIIPEIRIAGVERLPIGIYKCPTSNRRPNTIDGVPITYGCNATMDKISKCLIDVEEEFEDKKAMIFADGKLFDGDNKISSRIFKSIKAGGKLGENSLIDVFDPAFRETSYFAKLEQYFTILEKEVGTSRGILTDLSVSGATATEIKRSTYQTFAICDDIHTNAEKYINDLVYGINVLANYYSMTPVSEYEISFTWSYALLEDTDSTFNQLLQAHSKGAVDTAEIRQFVTDAETLEESQDKVNQIKLNGGNVTEMDIQAKIWLAEVASGLMKPETYLMKRYGVTEEQALEMLPDPLGSTDIDTTIPVK